VPTSFLIGRDGRIRQQTVGDPDFARLRERIAQELGKSAP
jgi:hypothetical protein